MNTASPAAHVDSDKRASEPILNGVWQNRRDILTDLGDALNPDNTALVRVQEGAITGVSVGNLTFDQHLQLLSAIAGSLDDTQS